MTVHGEPSRKCIKCNKSKSAATEFKRRSDDYISNQCKTCDKDYTKYRNNSEHGFLSNLWNQSKSHNNIRNNNGRKLDFTLSLEHVKSMWKQQRGRCAITNMTMVLKPHSDYKCSIERLDNNVGYTDKNCTLVINEVNTRNQWTRQKAQYLFGTMVHPPTDLTDQIVPQVRSKIAKGSFKRWIIDNKSNVFCHFCKETKARSQFNKVLNTGCKTCVKNKNIRNYNTWWGTLQALYNNAKTRSKKREMELTITFQELVDILVNQKGLCYYSGVPMKLKMGDYRLSIERINVLDSYNFTNTVFCCQEFNSGDHSRSKTEDSNDGCSGWSKKKYLEVQQSVFECSQK